MENKIYDKDDNFEDTSNKSKFEQFLITFPEKFINSKVHQSNLIKLEKKFKEKISYGPEGDTNRKICNEINLIYEEIDSYEKYELINNEINSIEIDKLEVDHIEIKNIKIKNSEFDNYFTCMHTEEYKNILFRHEFLESILIENSFKNDENKNILQEIFNNLNFIYKNLLVIKDLTPQPCSNLSQIIIKNCNLTSENLFPIINILKNRKIKTLNLDSNLLGDKAISYLDLLYNNTSNKNFNLNSLEILNISNNQITDKSGYAIFNILNSSSFSGNLELNKNLLTNKFVVFFSKKVMLDWKNSKSVKLMLKHINFDYETLKSLSKIDLSENDKCKNFNFTIYITNNHLSDKEKSKLENKKISFLKI